MIAFSEVVLLRFVVILCLLFSAGCVVATRRVVAWNRSRTVGFMDLIRELHDEKRTLMHTNARLRRRLHARGNGPWTKN